MPLIFGIPFDIDINDLPDDGLILNINKNLYEKYTEEVPKLSGKLQAFFVRKLNQFKEKYKIEEPINSDKWMDYLDAVEPKEIPNTVNTIDCGEIRDIFYDVFIQMFKNYQKFFNFNLDKYKEKNKDQEENENEEQPRDFHI